MNNPAIRTEKVRKSFGSFVAVDAMDISVPAGVVYGFLGPNGAGKTTFMRMLLGLSLPDSGSIEIFGENIFSDKETILEGVGAVIESPAFFEYMSAYENLSYLARLTAPVDEKKIWEALETVGLDKVARKKVGKFSYGMKQRLGIAQAILPENRLIFLDEPTNGLDPHGIVGVRELIKKLCREKGITVFISSHLLSEVELVCDSVTIIDRGVKICESSVAELVGSHFGIEIKTDDRARFMRFCDENGITILDASPENNGNLPVFIISGKEVEIPAITGKMVKEQIKVFSISEHRYTLEEIFVEFTGKNKENSFSDRF